MKTIELAERLNISDSTYRRYERNEIAPDLNIIGKIANIYDLTIVDLLSEDKIIMNNNQSGGTSNNALVINQLSEKIIEQFELRIKEKDKLIDRLSVLIDKFSN